MYRKEMIENKLFLTQENRKGWISFGSHGTFIKSIKYIEALYKIVLNSTLKSALSSKKYKSEKKRIAVTRKRFFKRDLN